MSLLMRAEESVNAKQEFLVEIRPSRRIIVVRPGSRAHLALNLDSPPRLKLKLTVEGLTPDIARYSLASETGETPFVVRLDITANPGAVGIYPFKVIAQDVLSKGFSTENLILIITTTRAPHRGGKPPKNANSVFQGLWYTVRDMVSIDALV